MVRFKFSNSGKTKTPRLALWRRRGVVSLPWLNRRFSLGSASSAFCHCTGSVRARISRVQRIVLLRIATDGGDAERRAPCRGSQGETLLHRAVDLLFEEVSHGIRCQLPVASRQLPVARNDKSRRRCSSSMECAHRDGRWAVKSLRINERETSGRDSQGDDSTQSE